MSFLEATRIVREFAGGPSLPFRLAMSGTADPLTLYLRAAAAQLGYSAEPVFLPFNTLQQAVLTAQGADMREVFLLMPWDLSAELDWRTGVPKGKTFVEEELLGEAASFLSRVKALGARMVYVAAPCPPLWLEADRNAAFQTQLCALVLGSHGSILPAELFSLSTYLASGSPFNGAALHDVADRVVGAVLENVPASAKVLVTDLDQTLWSGIVGDDGSGGIEYGAQGKGYPHFLYQTLLLKLRTAGVLLAAVSKNNPETALAPLRAGGMVLSEDDFVAILASWNAKSAQIRLLADQLNLGLDAFVFVDDNPVELAEVERELPMVTRVCFPAAAKDIPALFERLVQLFPRTTSTAEDLQRTELYRRRLEGMVPSEVAGADLTQYLRSLAMTLVIANRSNGDRTRALQLLNKTNQFNANGRRLLDEEVQSTIDAGGQLYTATLTDRTGSHGEILTALIDGEGVVRSLAMSCRVFQRRVEFAFLAWLADEERRMVGIDYLATDRNEPVRRFLTECLGNAPREGVVQLEASVLRDKFADELELFHLSEEVAA